MSGIFQIKSKLIGSIFILVILMLLLCGCETKQNVQKENKVNGEKSTNPNYEIKTEEMGWELSYNLTEEDVIKPLNFVQEMETEKYFIKAIIDKEGEKPYPQIILKEEDGFFYDIDYLNSLLREAPRNDYHVLYADEYYISLWYGAYTDGKEEVKKIYNINIKYPIVESSDFEFFRMLDIQDGNDYPNAPWPTNGLTIRLEEVLEEIEYGNCYLDTAGYIIYKKAPQLIIESIRKQFEQIKKQGIQEAYDGRRYFFADSQNTYMVYVKENRVGFYIRLQDRWNKNQGELVDGEYPYDFKVEVEYDWKKNTQDYHIPYEIYGVPLENNTCGTVYYPQVKGVKEEIQDKLNNSMKEWVTKNLEYINIEEWQKIMDKYVEGREYWTDYISFHGVISIEHFVTTFQNDKYVCIFQQPKLSESTVLSFAEQWQRYNVFDLGTGNSLKLGDVIRLDEEFVSWLKEEKKIEATGEYYDGVGIVHTEMMDISLDGYSEDLLLSVLENAEFWMKSGQLFIRLPHYDEKSGGLWYLLGGSSWPNYIQYTETRISLEDLGEFLQVEPW